VCIHDMEPIPFAFFVERIAAAEKVLGLQPSTHSVFDDTDNDDLGTKPEYPPSSAQQIIKFCPTLNYVAQQKGNVEEPLWRGMLGIVKHCTEGEELAHEWSDGHPDYKRADTQHKLERWGASPTTCSYFRTAAGSQCAGCERNVSSPILLGYTDTVEAPAVAGDVVNADSGEDSPSTEPAKIPNWPKGFTYNAFGLQAAIKDAEGAIHWVTFCSTLIYVEKRVRAEDGIWHLSIRHFTRDKVWRVFLMPCEYIGSQTGIAGFLASHEVFITGKFGVQHMKDFMREYALALQEGSIEQVTYGQLGWADEDSSFILGNQRIRAGGVDTILHGDRLAHAKWDGDLGTAGSIERWVHLVNEIYNRPGAEPYQFALAAAFAAPLVSITGVGNWNGIPVALTGKTGLGKSTICKVGVSIYGNPDKLFIEAGRGATYHALIARVGLARHLPLVFDEVTRRDPKEVQDLLFALSNGKNRERVMRSGVLADPGDKWQTITYITSNDNLAEILSSYDKAQAGEASQIRLFEIALESDLNERIWQNFNAVELIEHQLLKNYGLIGREWLRYIIEHRDKLQEEIRKVRTKYNPNNQEETRERFYRDLIATVAVALKHIIRLGWANFDLLSVIKWARQNVIRLRTQRIDANTPEDLISQFIASLHGGIIMTRHFKDGRNRENIEAPMQDLRQAPVARMAIDDKVFLVTRKCLQEWCVKNKVSASSMLDELMGRGFIKYTRTSSGTHYTRKDRIVKGTAIPGSSAVCIEFAYDRIAGMEAAPQEGNVVQLRASDGPSE